MVWMGPRVREDLPGANSQIHHQHAALAAWEAAGPLLAWTPQPLMLRGTYIARKLHGSSACAAEMHWRGAFSQDLLGVLAS